MTSFLRRHEIWIFFVLIVAINGAFIGGISAGAVPMGTYALGRFALLAAVLVAVVVAARGPGGVWELLAPMLKWRVPPVWYAVALLWGVANMVLFLVGKGLVSGTGLGEVSANLGVVTRPSVLVTLFISSFVGEIVWISYAVRRLSESFTIYVAALITGVVWTLWWAPMIALNIGILPDLPFAALLVNQVGVAAVAAFLYWHTRSGLVVLIGQIMFNGALLVFPVAPNSGGIPTYYAFAVTFLVTATALYLVKGPRPLFRTEGRSPVRIA